MSSSEKEERKIPEWDIFKRIKDLEDLYLEQMQKIDETEPALRDTSIVALLAFMIGIESQLKKSSNPPKTAERWINLIKDTRLSEKEAESLVSFIKSVAEAYSKRTE